MSAPGNIEVLLDPFAFLIKLNRPHPDPKRFDHGWRTDMLAIPNGHKEELALFGLSSSEVAKYERMKRASQLGDNKHARVRLQARIHDILKKHTDDMCLAPVRVYQTQRKIWKDVCGKKFDARMKHFTEAARQSVYHEYDRARQKLKKDKKAKKSQSRLSKSKKGRKSGSASTGGKRKKRTKEELRAAALENVDRLATPKKAAKAGKISRGKHGEINPETFERLKKPKAVTPKFVNDSMTRWRTEHYVSESALHYQPSQRMYELAVHKARVMEPPPPEGFVEPDALHYKPSARILELAVPKARNAVQEADYNDDAFKVSPNALHYKASERIIELAKPIDRP